MLKVVLMIFLYELEMVAFPFLFHSFTIFYKFIFKMFYAHSAPNSDGGGPGAQAWWMAPCANTESLGRG